MPSARNLLRFVLAPALLVLAGAGALLLPALGSAQNGFPDVRGLWNAGACVGGTLAQCEANDQYPQTFTIETEDFGTGAVTGTSPCCSITGSVSGNTLHTHSIDHQVEYNSDATYTINAEVNKLTGTFSDSYGRVNQPTFASRASGPPTTTTSTTSTSTTSGLRATATSVLCNYDVASSTDTCGATVGDAGPAPSVAPTGTVKFTGSAPGSFASGATCQLQASPSAPTAPSCNIVFYTSDGTVLPAIVATYSGDSQHSSSSGSTHYFGANPSGETTGEAGTAPPGQYPNEVEVSTNVPADNTEIQACAVPSSTSGSAAGFDIGSITKDITEAAGSPLSPRLREALKALTELNGLNNEVKGATPAQANAKITEPFAKSANTDLSKILGELHLAEGELGQEPASAPDRQQAQQALKQEQQLLDQLSKSLKEQNEAACSVIKNTGSGRAVIAASHKTAKKRKGKLVRVALTTLHGVPHGPLKIKLHLSRTQLKRLAGKHHSVKLTLRVNMTLPSRVIPGGYPESIVKHITLTPAKKKPKKGKK